MFKTLFQKTKGVQDQPEAPKLSSAIAGSISNVVGKRSIPPMSRTAQRAFRLSIDPNASARDFVGVIESDEALSARVLKIANSVFFERGKKSETIEQCVTVIGVNELRNLLSATTLSDIFPSKHPARAQLWANDIATALAAKVIARRLSHPKSETAFLAGLMHDIGKLLLLQRVERDYSAIIERVGRTGRPFCEVEEEIFVFNHVEVGQFIAEHWNFAPDLIEAIRNHHQNGKDYSGTDMPLSRIVHAADASSHALGLGHRSGFGSLQNRAQEELEEIYGNFGFSPGEKKELLQEIQKAFEVEKELYEERRA